MTKGDIRWDIALGHVLRSMVVDTELWRKLHPIGWKC